MEKISVNQSEIWLVPFSFSDLSGQKVRPILVISNNGFNASSEDVIVCAITSNITKEKYTVLVTRNDLVSGELHDSCVVKAETFFKINKKILIKKIGQVHPALLKQVREKLILIL